MGKERKYRQLGSPYTVKEQPSRLVSVRMFTIRTCTQGFTRVQIGSYSSTRERTEKRKQTILVAVVLMFVTPFVKKKSLSSSSPFGKNGTVPLVHRFCCENAVLSILKRKGKDHLYGGTETDRNPCIQTGLSSSSSPVLSRARLRKTAL